MIFNLGRIVKQTSIVALLVGMGLASSGCNDVASIVATPVNPTLAIGGTQQLTVTAYNKNSTTGTVITNASTLTFTSDSPAVATVSASGLITAVATGTAGITVLQNSTGLTSTVSVTVGPVAMFSISGSVQGLAAGFNVGIANTATGEELHIFGANSTPSAVSFAFSTLMLDTTAWSVVVVEQPTGTGAPTCGVEPVASTDTGGIATGTIAAANVTGLVVRCATGITATATPSTLIVGETGVVTAANVPALTGNIANADLTCSASTSDITFGGTSSNDCSLMTATNGPIGAQPVVVTVTDTVTGQSTTVNVTVREAVVTATAVGLGSGLSVTLTNTVNSDTLTLTDPGSLTGSFATGLDVGGAYAITIASNANYPTGQDCQVSGGSVGDGSGVIAAGADAAVTVTCGDEALTVSGNPSPLAVAIPTATPTVPGIVDETVTSTTGGLNIPTTALNPANITWSAVNGTATSCVVSNTSGTNGQVTIVGTTGQTCTVTATYHGSSFVFNVTVQ